MAGLNLQLEALTLPDGTEFPGTPQALLNLIAAYMAITGQDDFSGINFGDTEPAPDDRDKPWFKTDGSGNPIGWFAWNGAAWASIPITIPSGATADRPVSPTAGTLYRDTDLDAGGVTLIYTGSAWVTLDGTPGDVKFVAGVTLVSVLAKNPGWSHYTDGIGRVLAGAAADGSDAQTNVGADEVTLTEDQMPEHKHTGLVVTGSEADAGDAGGFAVVAASQSVGLTPLTASETGLTGGTDPVDVRQATRMLFCLIKN